MADLPAWGIHITAASVRGVKVEEEGDQLRVVAHDQIDFAEDIDDINRLDRHAALAHAIVLFMKRHDLSKCRVWISVDGSAAFNRFVGAPLIQGESLLRILEYEAQQQIPFDLSGVYFDHKVLSVKEDDATVDVILFAIKKEVVDERLRRLTKIRFPVDGVQLAPVALYNYAVREDLARDGHVLVSVDYDRIDVVVCHGKRFWFRTLPTGVYTMVRDLCQALDIKHRLAVRVARGEVAPDDATAFDRVRSEWIDRTATEIARLIDYYRGALDDVEFKGIVLVPGSTLVPALGRRLRDLTGLEAGTVKSFRTLVIDPAIETPEIANSVSLLAHATGLALQGLDRADVGVKLQPANIERIIAGRRVFYVLAILVVFLIVGLMWFIAKGYSEEIVARRKQVDDRLGQIEGAIQAFQKKQKESQLKDQMLPFLEIGRHRLTPLEATDLVLDTLAHVNQARAPADQLYVASLLTRASDQPGVSLGARLVEVRLGQVESADPAEHVRTLKAELERSLGRDPRVSDLDVPEHYIAADLALSPSPNIEDKELRRRFVMMVVVFVFDPEDAGGGEDQDG